MARFGARRPTAAWQATAARASPVAAADPAVGRAHVPSRLRPGRPTGGTALARPFLTLADPRRDQSCPRFVRKYGGEARTTGEVRRVATSEAGVDLRGAGSRA